MLATVGIDKMVKVWDVNALAAGTQTEPVGELNCKQGELHSL